MSGVFGVLDSKKLAGWLTSCPNTDLADLKPILIIFITTCICLTLEPGTAIWLYRLVIKTNGNGGLLERDRCW